MVRRDFTHLRFELEEGPRLFWEGPGTRTVWELVQVYISDSNRMVTHRERVGSLRLPESWASAVVVLLEELMGADAELDVDLTRALDAWGFHQERIELEDREEDEERERGVDWPRCECGGRLRKRMTWNRGTMLVSEVCSECQKARPASG